MSIELKVPSAGESITEVTIVEWLKEEGAWADRDETVALIETDKANVEVNAPVAGRIEKIVKSAGDIAEVGEVIATMAEGGERPAAEATSSGSTSEAPSPPPAAASAPADASAPKTTSDSPAARPPSPSATPDNGQILASPSERRLIREHKVPVAGITGSGPGGRVSLGDLQRHLRAEPTGGSREEDRVPMTPLRKRIAGRLVEAQQTSALLTTFNEVDMTNVMALRKEYQEAFTKRHGIKLGFMSFFVKAVIEGLKDYPQLNAWIDGEDIVYHNYYDIGVAVGGGRGLVVPVLRNAERLSFAQVEQAIADFAERAKGNRLKVEELEGGTFTVSNGGIYGSLMSTPIINPPQSGILGMHAIQDRPVVRDGEIAIGKMMYLAVTYDHRLVDGREAVSFLVRIKEVIENPTRLVLEV